MKVDRAVTDAERTTWKEIKPGIFARQILEHERRLDRQFVEKVAEAAGSANLRLLILETGKNPNESTRTRKRKSVREALAFLF